MLASRKGRVKENFVFSFCGLKSLVILQQKKSGAKERIVFLTLRTHT
jgi:hypothetical protein